MDGFDKLLQLYLDGIASREERIQLFRLILSGEYDYGIDGRLISMMEDEMRRMAPDDEKVILEKLYQKLNITEVALAPVQGRVKKRYWIPAATVVLLITVIVTAWVVRSLVSQENNTAPGSEKFLAFSGKQFIRLPDGSTVLLNDSSQLSYRESEAEGFREVTLTGEAFFDVKPSTTKAFVVRSGNVKTTVLGTSFNISARPHQKQVVVTCTRGKVQVSNEQHKFDVIKPNEQLAVNTVTHSFVKTTVSADTGLEWKNSFLIIDRVPLEEAAILIGNKYNVTVVIADAQMKPCVVSSTFMNNENLEDVLRIISTLVQGDFNISGSTATLTGKGCR
ncbi:FecR domain-containing protein [Fulvivirgaceae bacterium PWU4]|uniref:FecR domain-containing protein n=1 Tax=Chryseosolibacter histidini TaxID=2782349 RepID=A0AAP2GJ37_9BACT|nr:FecR domain-containing protein [Chryseosolibacter histidini]MBT1697926.1 FecR domain-containing protein [Chryseosolibacter histidini]